MAASRSRTSNSKIAALLREKNTSRRKKNALFQKQDILLHEQIDIAKISLQQDDKDITRKALKVAKLTLKLQLMRQSAYPPTLDALPSPEERRPNRSSSSLLRERRTKSPKKLAQRSLNFDGKNIRSRALSSTEEEKVSSDLSSTEEPESMTPSSSEDEGQSASTDEEISYQPNHVDKDPRISIEKQISSQENHTSEDKEKIEETITKKTYNALYSSTVKFIKTYTQKKSAHLSLTKRLNSENENKQGEAIFKELYAIARALYKKNTYIKRIALPTFCMATLMSSPSINKLHSLYFCKAMQGAGDSDPDKRSPLKRILMIAGMVIGVSLVAGFLFSLGLGFFYLGVHVALSTNFWTILAQGWTILLPYKFVIPIASGIINQLLVRYFFGKSSIQKKLDAFDKLIKPPPPDKDNYPDSDESLELLENSVETLKDSPLKNSLVSLYEKLYEKINEAKAEATTDPNKMNYLMPILFTATAFANNLTQGDQDEELIRLSFYALKGAGFTEPPGQSVRALIGRVLPMIIIIGIAAILAFFLSSCYAFLILNTTINILSECISCISLIPKEMLETEHQERANKIFKNSITQCVSEIEENLADSIKPQTSSHKKFKKEFLASQHSFPVTPPTAAPVAAPVVSSEDFLTTPSNYRRPSRRTPRKLPEKQNPVTSSLSASPT